MTKRPPFQNLGGDRGRVQFIDPLTGRRDDFYGTHAECLAKVEQIRHLRGQLLLGASAQELALRQPASHDRRTLDDLWKLWSRRATDSSLRVYSNHWKVRIAPYLGKRCAWELSPEVLYDWVAGLRERYAPNTVKATAELVLMVARVARLAQKPWDGFRLPRATPKRARHSLASLEELEAVLLAARNEDEERWRKGHFAYLSIAMLVATLTGLRNAELAGLSWRDLRLDATDPDAPALMTIARQAPRRWHLKKGRPNGKTEPDTPPKGKTIETLPLHPEAADALRAHREEMKRAGLYHPRGPVFPDERGFWRTNGEVIRAEQTARIVRKAGLDYDGFTTHELRHTYVTFETIWNLRRRGDPRQIQARARHKDLKTTMAYIHSVGPGLAPSAIPRLSVHIVPAIAPKPAENSPPELPPAGGNGQSVGLAQLSALRSSSFEMVPVIVKVKKPSLRDTALRIVALPEDERPELPDEVRDLARTAYQRAYRRKKGRGGSPKQCQTAGRRGNNALLVAWKRTLRRALEAQSRAQVALSEI